MVRPAADIAQTPRSGTETNERMVAGEPSSNTAIPSGKARIETQGPFRLLRNHGQPTTIGRVSVAAHPAVEILAKPARPLSRQYAVGANASPAGFLVSACGQSGALCFSKTMLLKNRMREIC